jgi:hypothetical protein
MIKTVVAQLMHLPVSSSPSAQYQPYLFRMSSRRESDFTRLKQLLREADERIEQERRRAEEADERANDERRNRKEADERVELERRRAEDERRRAEEAERNQKEADERAEQERMHAEHERWRAEDERRNRIKEEKKTRPTTFEEYLCACYTLLSRPLRIQTEKSLSTQGSITSPKNKPCPTLLKP